MITEELRKYINMVIQEGVDNQLFEMANLHSDSHGIEDVVIWVGRAPKQHGLRVKVSNAKNKFDESNNFVIQMPSLDYDPTQVAKWINTKTMNQIFEWIKLNQPLLNDYENGILDNTRLFIDSISKI